MLFLSEGTEDNTDVNLWLHTQCNTRTHRNMLTVYLHTWEYAHSVHPHTREHPHMGHPHTRNMLTVYLHTREHGHSTPAHTGTCIYKYLSHNTYKKVF